MRHAACDSKYSQTHFMGVRKDSRPLTGTLWDAFYANVSQIGSMLECAVFGFAVHVVEVSRPVTNLILRS